MSRPSSELTCRQRPGYKLHRGTRNVAAKNPAGVMQGRLSPKYHGRYQAHPVGYWQDEFYKARDLGLDCIEFILDFNDADANPLLRAGGVEAIHAMCEATGVGVSTVCADYFMEAPLHHTNDAIADRSEQLLGCLLKNGQKLGLTDIVLPCVDQASLADAAGINRFVRRLSPLLEVAERAGINISLETDLRPHAFAELLARFDSERLTVNYDTGNSASWGYDPAEELACYGPRITDIHIKDRVLGGGSVMLGTGDVQFARFFEALRPLNYLGPLILQVYRDDEGCAVFKKQLEWFRIELLSKHYHAALGQQ